MSILYIDWLRNINYSHCKNILRWCGQPGTDRVFKTSDADKKLSTWAQQYNVGVKEIQKGKDLADRNKMATWDTHVILDDNNFNIYNDYGV